MPRKSFSLLIVPLLASLWLLLGACGGSESDGSPTVVVASGTTFPSSPVRIIFSVSNFMIGLPGTPHLRFSIDGGPLNDFYNGTGIDSENGVQLNGVHTHFVHWATSNSFDLFGLAAGSHLVRLVLVNASNTALTGAGASTTQSFTVQSPPSGDLQLQSRLSGLNFPVGLSEAPDGRIFFNERLTGMIRTINPGWLLDPLPFCQVSVQVGGEQGLLGLALDPAFSSSNEVAYVYYTASGPVNRVSRLSKSGGVCTETIILDNLPASWNHNGGIIKFGPDLKLFVVIGDAEDPSNAQNIDSFSGKILRVNSDGSAPTDNPFYASDPNPDPNSPRKKVYSYGHRNSFGITFHPTTNQLWESENGPSDNDEINRIIAGGNYGWDTSFRGGILNDPCCIDPVFVFHPPLIAPTEIVGIPGNSPLYPQAYQNNLLVAAWNDGTIRLVIPNVSDPSLPGTSSVAYPGGQGGLVSMMLASDGFVYVSKGGTGSPDGEIFQVVAH